MDFEDWWKANHDKIVNAHNHYVAEIAWSAAQKQSQEELALYREDKLELANALNEAADYIKNGELYEGCNSDAVNKYRNLAKKHIGGGE